MFGRIASRYDVMNAVMTGGLDRRWRAAAVRAAAPPADGRALDVGTGTAKLALALARAMPGGRVVGLDLALPMLRAAQSRLVESKTPRRVRLVQADALGLPFADGTFDCLTSAFTVRNLPHLTAAFREQARVVRPGGRIVCLELTWPRSPLMRAIFPLYFGRFVPLLGSLLAGDAAAYSYLAASVRAFPAPDRLAAVMQAAGLRDVRWRTLGFGTVTLHVGTVARRGSGYP
jgi:demethylmenaquinone methyltransferase/2-methoxy-6-polyprenyl-1,4-benzoquinol methylase